MHLAPIVWETQRIQQDAPCPQRLYPRGAADRNRKSNTWTYHLMLGCLLGRERMDNRGKSFPRGRNRLCKDPEAERSLGLQGAEAASMAETRLEIRLVPSLHSDIPISIICLNPWLSAPDSVLFFYGALISPDVIYVCIHLLLVPSSPDTLQQRLHKAGIWSVLFPAVSSDHTTVTGT